MNWSSAWDSIRLVAFDVDGTLYRQRSLRLRIARDMLFYSVLKRDCKLIPLLRTYRRIREQLGNEEVHDFSTALLAETAAATGMAPNAICAIVTEWMEERPLHYLNTCRYPGVPELFEALRRRGKVIGILSDYPAHAKLAALGLAADHAVAAHDERVGYLKPHPRGLETLIASAGVEPNQTVLIGDRAERDGLAAQRAGAHALIRSSKSIAGWQTFARFDDQLFAPLLAV